MAMLWGYVWRGLAANAAGTTNPEFRRWLRRWQWRALLVGKQRAVQELLRDRAANQPTADRT